MADKKMHPDELATLLSKLAHENGYGITDLRLIGLKLSGGCIPVHEYILSDK